jgi:hypothetical protein
MESLCLISYVYAYGESSWKALSVSPAHSQRRQITRLNSVPDSHSPCIEVRYTLWMLYYGECSAYLGILYMRFLIDNKKRPRRNMAAINM